jgi:hypothetical protein
MAARSGYARVILPEGPHYLSARGEEYLLHPESLRLALHKPTPAACPDDGRPADPETGRCCKCGRILDTDPQGD